MKTLARGTHYAVASMMQQATVAAEHVLSAGGNAFDAIVAGQAVLGYYDRQTKELFVRSDQGTLSPAARETLAHDLNDERQHVFSLLRSIVLQDLPRASSVGRGRLVFLITVP